jgi:PAS domain S-box-containing protein
MPIKPIKSVGVLATATIFVIALTVGFLIWSLRERELKHALLETVSITEMLMEQTEQNVESTDLVLQGVQERLMTSFGSQIPLDSAPVHLLLNARVSGVRHLRSLFVVDVNGVVINSSRDMATPKTKVADRAYFKVFAQGKENALFIDKPVRSRLDNTWILNISRPLLNVHGKFRGVVVAAIDIYEFEQIYRLVQLDYPRPIGLYQADGTLIASLPHRESLIGEHAPELTNEMLPPIANQIRTIRHASGDGAQVVFAVGRLVGYPLWLGVGDEEALSLASWRETAIPIVAGAALVCIFTALVAIYLIGKLRDEEILADEFGRISDRYQHTVNALLDGVVAVDASLSILLFNPAAERMFGRSAQDTIGQPLDVLIPVRFKSQHGSHIDRFTKQAHGISSTLVPQQSIVGLRADGKEFPIESTFSKSMIGGQLQLTAVLRDVTDKRVSENDLRVANAQLRELSSSLQNVREQERTRISRELHDDLGQQLTGLKLSLSWLGTRIREGRTTAAQNVDDMRYQLDAAIASVRRIAAELRPRVLDDLDFGEALTWQTQEFTKRSDLDVTLHLPAAGLVNADNLATALFRIVQEALTNVVRHANATQVRIGLVNTGDDLVLTIHDNGVGFESVSPQNGIGLVSMRERSAAIGGRFRIVSAADAGTTIEVVVPLDSLVGAKDKV